MSTRVVNVKYETCDEYIGRGCRGYRKSPWANAYKLVGDGTRQDCIDAYEVDLRARLAKDPTLKKKLLALDGLTLGCWCKPKACHGDILIKLIEELKEAEHGEKA